MFEWWNWKKHELKKKKNKQTWGESPKPELIF
jgi:hypothetical protein